MENRDQEMALDITEIVRIIKKRFWIIALVTIMAVLFSGIYSFYFIKPMYESRISVVIGRVPINAEQNTMDYSDIMMFQNLVKTYAKIAESRTVMQDATDALKLNKEISPQQMLGEIIVTPEVDTQIMNIDIKDGKAQTAMDEVNAVAAAFIKEAQRIFPDGNVQTIDEAIVPKHPVSPNKKLNIAIALFLGLIISLGLIFLIEYLDNTIKNESSVEKYTGMPVIGLIPKCTKHMAM